MQLLSVNTLKLLAQLATPFLTPGVSLLVNAALGAVAPAPVQPAQPTVPTILGVVPFISDIVSLVAQIEHANPGSAAQDAEVKALVHELYTIAPQVGIVIPVPETAVDDVVDAAYTLWTLVGNHQQAAAVAASPSVARIVLPAAPTAPLPAGAKPKPVVIHVKASPLPEAGTVPIQPLDAGIGRGGEV